ncbi:MAG: HIT domain-containing protein [Acidobacteriota bacterium]|nr:HIT domain-containing protein [Acidobacteriota bacterium]
MRSILLLVLLGAAARADIVTCGCDLARPETMEARQCSLCREAEKQPADVKVFVLKDVNPSKPGRWLVLPRVHPRSMELLDPALRAELWSAAIAKGRALFGDDWAVAYNSPSVQTQCHVHVHIGKLMQGVETDRFITVTKIEDIPPPPPGEGFWIHPQGNLFHVHTGEQITETVLLR